MKFKRIYIEITNICNLKCSFCSNSKRNKKEMSIDEFKLVMSKITIYTDYIYLHVKGETLSHHYLDDILSICKKYNKKVCITTNGVFLKDRLDILPETNLCSNCAKNQPDLHLTSREENQRLINKGYMFYDETVMKLNEMNKMPKDESDRD